MKTRLTATAVAISTLIALTGCSKNSTNSDPVPTPAPAPTPPTVTVTAPATATAGIAFDVAWTSTDATSCAADFTTKTDASGTESVTDATAEKKTYTVTCTGAGGTASGSADVQVGAATAEGFWQGTTGNGRILSGVVTKEGNYWLAYTKSASDTSIAGFYAGEGASAMTTAPAGTFTSSDLREVNFEHSFTGGVNTAAGKIQSANYSAKTALSGSFDQVSANAATVTTTSLSGITVDANTDPNTTFGTIANYAYLASGAAGSADPTNGGTFYGVVHFSTPLSPGVNGAQADVGFKFTINAGAGTAQSIVISCVNGKLNQCGTNYAVGTTANYTLDSYSLSGSSVTWQIHNQTPSQLGTDVIQTWNYSGTASLTGLPTIAANSFTFGTYNAAYETTPAVASLAGSYSGTAGVGSATASANLVVDSSGAVTSGALGTCSVSLGSFTSHATGGNVYDVALTLSGCASAGNYTGSATLSGKVITVMALNANRDSGVMFSGTTP